MEIQVQCHAGYRGEETPRAFRLGDRQVAVAAVLDRWLAPDHRYFKVAGDDGGIYILRHDPAQDRWEMTLFQASSPVAAGDGQP
ncbi:MAG: hypothetical protein JRF23_08250 [Deltaproteobacteria bacterium]|nr:hypothetical protein [Deltaproteobacteria bacterium]